MSSSLSLPPLDKPYRIIIVDDHKFVVELLAQRLQNDPKIKIVGLANRGSSAIHIVEQSAVDIALLDMDLGEDDGITVAKDLFELQPNIRIIGLSVHDSDNYPIRLLELGGSGFISKKATGREIIDGITRVADGEMAISSKIAVHIATAYSKVNSFTQLRTLSDKEREILALIAIGHRIAEIASIIGISEKTVHGHRSSLRKKLNAKTDVELCLHAIKYGLVDPRQIDLDGGSQS